MTLYKTNQRSLLNKTFTPLEDWYHGGEFFPHRGQRVFFKRALLIYGFPTASWDWSFVWGSRAAGIVAWQMAWKSSALGTEIVCEIEKRYKFTVLLLA